VQMAGEGATPSVETPLPGLRPRRSHRRCNRDIGNSGLLNRSREVFLRYCLQTELAAPGEGTGVTSTPVSGRTQMPGSAGSPIAGSS